MRGSRRGALYGLAAVIFALVAPVTADRPSNVMPSLTPVDQRNWSGTVSAFPAPGTPTANPKTGISLRGVAPSDIDVSDLRVVGSRTGRHSGSLQAHSDGEGVSFQPNKPFRAGEVVTVHTELEIRGGHKGRFRFAIARPVGTDKSGGASREVEPEATKPATLSRYKTFRTMPGVRPPKVQVVDPANDPSRGYIFVAPKKKAVQRGPMIVDPQGQLVWFRPQSGVTTYDFKVQQYRGEKVLTWWEGSEARGHGSGEYVIVDQSYREIARVTAGNGYSGDLHEFIITPRGTALLISYSKVKWDLSAVGGPEVAPVFEAVVQEVDIKTGAVLFEWHSLGAVRLTESYQKLDSESSVYDYIHPNSVSIDSDGNLLVSARHTSTVYKLDRSTGEIIWRLGGKRSDFELGEGVRFSWQHDARRREDGHLTIFDNAGNSPQRQTHGYSRGIVLDLNMDTMTAELVREYPHPASKHSYSQANMQVLPNGHVFIGWGSQPRFTEYSKDGDVVFDAKLPERTASYRAYRSRWTGKPATRPAVVVEETAGGSVVVYASWNGSTEVAQWQVLAGPGKDRLKPVTTAPRDGFETTIVANVNGDDPVIAVRAKDDDGSTLATSKAVEVAQ